MKMDKEFIKQLIDEHLRGSVFHVVGDVADDLGRECYVVGGYVRDILLERPSKDIDFVTVGSGIEVAEAVAKALGPRTSLAVFRTYGTAQVKSRDVELEFVGARRESYTRNSRNPIVEDGTLEDDQQRRDFTVNAMMQDVLSGEIIDCWGGREDLKNGVIRCVNPGTFQEDALRILRALRFAAVYGFAIEEETAQAAHLLKSTLKHVAKERITVELSKLLCGAGAQEILLRHGAVIAEVLPAALHAEAIAQTPAQLPIRLAHLLRDEQDVRAALGALRLDNATAKAAAELIALKDRPEPESAVQWRKLLYEAGQERTQQLAAWKQWNVQPLQDVLARGDCWNLKMLAVTGKDLMAAGVPKGREVGRALEALLQAVIEEKTMNEKAALLNYINRQEIEG